ncbi:MAG: hypothetical protein RRZ68_02635 [Oscillospiraceae bacterium]
MKNSSETREIMPAKNIFTLCESKISCDFILAEYKFILYHLFFLLPL